MALMPPAVVDAGGVTIRRVVIGCGLGVTSARVFAQAMPFLDALRSLPYAIKALRPVVALLPDGQVKEIALSKSCAAVSVGPVARGTRSFLALPSDQCMLEVNHFVSGVRVYQPPRRALDGAIGLWRRVVPSGRGRWRQELPGASWYEGL